jgi:hypothetical protein
LGSASPLSDDIKDPGDALQTGVGIFPGAIYGIAEL